MSHCFGYKAVSTLLRPRNQITFGGCCDLTQWKRTVAARANHLGEKMMDAAHMQY
jgi:hypothetical protein